MRNKEKSSRYRYFYPPSQKATGVNLWMNAKRVTANDSVADMLRLGFAEVCEDATAVKPWSFTKAKLAYFNKQWISGDTNLEALELLRKRRVYPLVSFILGSPEDQVDDLRLPFRTLASIDLNVMISPAVLTPFPGTRLRKQVLEEGLVEDLEYDHYNGITPVLRTRYLSRKEVSRLRNEELVRYYFRPRYLKNLAREVWRRRLPLVLIQFLQMFTPIYYLNSDFSVRLDRRWLRLLLKLIRTPTKRIDQVSWK